jgi:hypothetical protein
MPSRGSSEGQARVAGSAHAIWFEADQVQPCRPSGAKEELGPGYPREESI